MILQALVDYYEVLAGQGRLPRPGWNKRSVSWALSLGDNGELLDVVSLQQEQERGKKTVLVPQEMDLPSPVKRAVNIAANFLCDNSTYILGTDNKGKPQRTMECFEACVELHKKLLEGLTSPEAKAVLRFFEHWNPQEAATNPALAASLDEIKKGANIVFIVNGRYVHENPEIAASWQKQYDNAGDAEAAQCLVTGQITIPARLHPSIKGIPGAQPSGASLVSFNADAYSSYGKEQGKNAPVGEYAAFAYGAALNYLVRGRENRMLLGNTMVLMWAKGAGAAAPDMFNAMMNQNDEEISERELLTIMRQLGNGQSVFWKGDEIRYETPFYILGIAPNAARLSIRFFLQNSFGYFTKKILEHQERLEIARPANDKREQLSFWNLLNETVNPNSREKAATPLLEGELMRAVLMGDRYPASLLNGVLLRIRAEHKVTRGKAAIIKAYYLQNPHKDIPEEVLTVELNESTNIPYRLGRAFSVLEAIQQAANPGINATIKDKYFNSAAATPATIFPLLLSLKEKHARKIDTGLRIHYEKQLMDILAPVAEKGSFPVRLTLPEQGSFQLGYYHQTQKRYEKKEETENV